MKCGWSGGAVFNYGSYVFESFCPLVLLQLRVDLEEFLFLREITGSVEIVREKRLEKVYFPVPKKCFALTERTKEDFLNNANRETSTSKIESLLDSVPMMRREMTHQVGHLEFFPSNILHS